MDIGSRKLRILESTFKEFEIVTNIFYIGSTMKVILKSSSDDDKPRTILNVKTLVSCSINGDWLEKDTGLSFNIPMMSEKAEIFFTNINGFTGCGNYTNDSLLLLDEFPDNDLILIKDEIRNYMKMVTELINYQSERKN